MNDGQPQFNYSAFLSYSHADRPWGEWLQNAIEAYEVPRELIGKVTPAGTIPRSLRPVFRDRWDLSAGHSLNEVIDKALRESRFLIVLCSPNAAKSAYVNEEIYRFKALGRANRLLPIIVAGRPGAGADECFPEALRFDRAADGSLVPSPNEPIAADARPEGDDKELAKLKIIAGMLGVGLDEIRKREAIEQQRRLGKARRIAGAMAALALVAVSGAGVAWWQYGVAEEQRAVAEERRAEAERLYDQALDSTLRFVTTSATFRILLDDKRGRVRAVRAALDDGVSKPADLTTLVAAPALKDKRCQLDTFDVAQIQEKGASDDFQNFIRQRNSADIWYRLVDVLLDYERNQPRELRRYNADIEEAELPVQWIKHAETIAGNLVRSYGDDPKYRTKLDQVKAAIVAHGCTPAKECVPDPSVANPAPGEFNELAQGSPAAGRDFNMVVQQRLAQEPLGTKCR